MLRSFSFSSGNERLNQIKLNLIRLEAKATYLMDRLQMCYVEVEESRTKYENLDDEK